MSFDIVKLYYPNTQYSDFNWFLCAKKVYDSDLGLDIIKVSPHVQFFCEKTGKTLKVFQSNPDEEIRPKLLVINGSYDDIIKADNLATASLAVANLAVENLAVAKGLDGVAIRTANDNSKNTLPADLICDNVTFVFKSGILKETTIPDRCGIIRYAKRNNSLIRETVKNFPTCEEIDEFLKQYQCHKVAKVLYMFLENV